MITCPFCTKSFKFQCDLDNHTVSHTKEKPHKCLTCSKTFRYSSSLKYHIKTSHDGQKLMKKKDSECHVCSFKCNGDVRLRMHLQKHSTELSYACSKPDCEFKTKYQKSLEQHVAAVHNRVRPFKCPSDGCKYKAKSSANLNSHLKIHSCKKPFVCAVPGCNYNFKRKDYLNAHVLKAHGEKKPLKCSKCDFQTKNRSDLKVHRLTHRKKKRFECQAPRCDFVSFRPRLLRLHFDRNHKKKGSRCTEPGCSFRCGSIILLKLHLQRHERPYLKCPDNSCSFSAMQKRTLLQHILRCHEDLQSATEVEARQFNFEIAGKMNTLHCCYPTCGYVTKVPHMYHHHRLTHNEEDKLNHVCAFCFSRFRHLSILKDDVRRHTREKHYSCSQCKYATLDTVELRKHARTHHIHVVPRGKEDEVTKCCTCGRVCLSYTELVLHSMSHLQPVVVLEQLKLHFV